MLYWAECPDSAENLAWSRRLYHIRIWPVKRKNSINRARLIEKNVLTARAKYETRGHGNEERKSDVSEDQGNASG